MTMTLAGAALLAAMSSATTRAAPEQKIMTAAIEPAGSHASRIALADPDPSKDGGTHLGRLLAQAKIMGPAVTQVTKVMVDGLAIPPLEREIMCLATLHLERGKYEWYQHMKVAEMMGVPKAKVDAIADDRFGDPVFNDRELALLAFTRQVVKTVRVDDPTLKAVQTFYDPRQIVESTLVIGTYMMLARVSEVAELPLDGTAAGASFWKSQEAKDKK